MLKSKQLGKKDVITNNEVIKVVLDTNIVISAAVSEGNPSEVFELLLSGKIKNYTTAEITEEVIEVINRDKIKKILDAKNKDFILNKYIELSQIVSLEVKTNYIKEDPDDNKFIDCALTGNANFIISGDRHLLDIKEFKGIKIVTPAEFLNIINTSE